MISHWSSKVEKAEPIHAKNTLQPISTCKSSLLKTQLQKAATSAPICQPFLSDHQRGKRVELFCHCPQLAKHFSFPWITSASGRLSRSQCYFPPCHTDYHVCFSSDTDQFNFMLETSASVSDKRARERTHWSMGSGTGCQQGKALMNNKYVHINIDRILQRCLDMSGWLPFQARMPPTYSQLHIKKKKKICKVISCVCACERIWISRRVVWARISGRCLWKCGAQLERETLHIPTRAKFGRKSLFRTRVSATTHSIKNTHVDSEIRHPKKERMWTQWIYIASFHVLIYNERPASVPQRCLGIHYPSHM